jgi:hypothetical protein
VNAADTIDALRRRGYSRSARHMQAAMETGRCPLARHLLTWDEENGFQLTPQAWTGDGTGAPAGTLLEMGAEQAVIELRRLGYDREAAGHAAEIAGVPGQGYRYVIGDHQLRAGPGGFRIEPWPPARALPVRCPGPEAARARRRSSPEPAQFDDLPASQLPPGADSAAGLTHTGGANCAVQPLHDPCHAFCSEDGRTEADLTVPGLLADWARQISGTPARPWAADPGLAGPWAADPGLAGPWRDPGISAILADIDLVDAHLDAAAPEIYRGDHPASKLANRWRRIAGGPASEGQEAVDALNLASGGNPRKGVTGDDSTILGELGDTVVAGLLGIQSITKDPDETWCVFLKALAKARSRVPAQPGSPPVTSAGEEL